MEIKLENVRLSFPALFRPKVVQGSDSEPRYSASLLLSKKDDAQQIDKLRTACQAVLKSQWPTKTPAGIKFCVHDGAEKDYDGYGPEIIFVSASSTIRPPVVDEFVAPIAEDSGKLYAGCYVNVILRLWAQDNQFGKRINAQLKAVQYAAEGEAFGDKPVDPASVFKSAAPAGEPAFGILGKPRNREPEARQQQPRAQEEPQAVDDVPF